VAGAHTVQARLQSQWAALPARGRWAIGAAAALLAGGFGWLLAAAADEERVYAFTGLAAEDAERAAAALQAAGIPFAAEAGGSALAVAASRVYEARMLLAAQGLPRAGGVGFELFDRESFGATEFRERVNYRRALEGELARTMQALPEVRSARVHLVVPERSLFRDDGRRPTASVVLTLHDGRAMREPQIQGIRHLVASAVEGLSAQDVTVLDARGGLLARPPDADGGDPLEMAARVEKKIERQVMDVLEPLVGAGKVRVRASAQVDLTRTSTTAEQFDAENAAVRSTQRDEETLPAAEAPGGVVGAQANKPAGAAGGASASAGGGSQRARETTNYEVPRTTRRVDVLPGRIERLSVAVVVDGLYTSGESGAPPKYAPRSAEETARLTELVKRAVGFDAARGDQVDLMSARFEAEKVPAEEPRPWLDPALVRAAMRWGALALLGLLLALFVGRPLARALAPSGRAAAVAALPAPMRVTELESQLESAPGAPPNPLRPRAQEARTKATALAEKDADRAGHVLRGWVQPRGEA
jgi:flagellar M-ring protein FliF